VQNKVRDVRGALKIRKPVPMTFSIPGFDLDAFVVAVLTEDLGGVPGAGGHYLTSESMIPADALFTGVMESRHAMTVAGLPIAAAFFQRLDPTAVIEVLVAEGDAVTANTELMRLKGNARALLSAERSALNTVQHLTGIATLTRRYVQRIEGTGAVLLDTRKTTPGLRYIEKWAVKIGGGVNHRFGLYDMILIKDNHVDYSGGIRQAIENANQYLAEKHKKLQIEIEVRNLEELEQVLQTGGVNRILLDNFYPEKLIQAVDMISGRYITEASGGITLENVRQYAECGVDYVSMGGLTHSVSSLDMSLKAVK